MPRATLKDLWYEYMAGSEPTDYPDEQSLRRAIWSLRRGAKMHVGRTAEQLIVRFWTHAHKPQEVQE